MLRFPKDLLLRSGGLIGCLRLVAMLFALAISILLARSLGPEDYGTYTLIITIVSVLALFLHGGMKTYLIRETSQLAADKRYSLVAGLRRRTGQWIAIGSVILLAGVWVLHRLSQDGMSSPVAALLFTFPLIPLVALNSTRIAFLKGLKAPVASQIPQNLVQPAAQLLLMVAFLVYIELSVRTAIYSLIGSTALAVFAGHYLLNRSTAHMEYAQPEYETSRWIFSLSPFALIAIITLLTTHVTTLIMGWLVTREEIAYLRIADRMAQIIVFSLTIVNIIVAPLFAENARNMDWARLEHIARSSVRLAFAISMPLALGLIIFGKPLVGLLFGSEYSVPVWGALTVLCIGQLINVFFGSVASILNMSGHELATVKGMLLGLTTNVVLALWLVPTYGATGAAVAVSMGYLVWNGFLAYRIRKILGLKTTPI